MNQKFIKSMFLGSLVLGTLVASTLPTMANTASPVESTADTKIVKFIKAVGLPESLNVIKSGSTYIAVVWNYPHAVNGKDMYVLLEDGQPKLVTIDGKVVMSSLDK
jgi:hypothetical protein